MSLFRATRTIRFGPSFPPDVDEGAVMAEIEAELLRRRRTDVVVSPGRVEFGSRLVFAASQDAPGYSPILLDRAAVTVRFAGPDRSIRVEARLARMLPLVLAAAAALVLVAMHGSAFARAAGLAGIAYALWITAMLDMSVVEGWIADAAWRAARAGSRT